MGGSPEIGAPSSFFYRGSPQSRVDILGVPPGSDGRAGQGGIIQTAWVATKIQEGQSKFRENPPICCSSRPVWFDLYVLQNMFYLLQIKSYLEQTRPFWNKFNHVFEKEKLMAKCPAPAPAPATATPSIRWACIC